jgi:manganese/zinc/iron transport system ATP- binding protein
VPGGTAAASTVPSSAAPPAGVTAAPVVPALEVHDLTVSYHRKPVLWNVDLAMPAGQAGRDHRARTGAGKSTLIKAVMGLIPLSSGWVQVFGRPVGAAQRIAYVPQRESVDWTFPVTAVDVVLMGRYGPVPWYRRIGGRTASGPGRRWSKVGMLAYADRQISNLSGGQQQRVFLARALVQEATST